jgi:hypothetical protein
LNNLKTMKKDFLVKAIVCLFTVVAYCSCKEDEEAPPKSAKCDIESFTAGDIKWTIAGTDITHTYLEKIESLKPEIVVSDGATITPDPELARDFFVERGVIYTVTAEDGKATKSYNVKAKVTSAKAILAFTVDGESWNIAEEDSLIIHAFPVNTEKRNLTPDITLSAGATVIPASNVPQDFFTEAGVTYTVTAGDGSKRTYVVKSYVYTCSIISFKVDGVDWDIVGDNIIHNYPAGTEVTNLTPVIVLSKDARVSPASGTSQNFSAPQGIPYTVTAGDGSATKTYTVKALVDKSTLLIKPDKLEFNSLPGEKDVIVSTNLNDFEYSVDDDVTWITFARTDSILTIKVTPNTGERRSANVTVSAAGAYDAILLVTQEAYDNSPSLSVDPKTLYPFGWGGVGQTIAVYSNQEYTATVEAGAEEWLSYEIGEGINFTITAQENTGPERSATITLHVDGADNVALKITQEANPDYIED